MTEKLLQIVFSFGFLKWVWDGAWYVWNKAYRNRITADLYVAYYKPDSNGDLEKSCFLVVRNGTDKNVVVSGFVMEDNWRARVFGRPSDKPFVAERELMTVPAGKGMQMTFSWMPANLIGPHRYFGVLLRNGAKVWVPTKRWKRVLREYKLDFPDWASHQLEGRAVQYKEYGKKEDRQVLPPRLGP